MYPQKVSVTPVKRRLDYKAALGIVDQSPNKNRYADHDSIYTDSASDYSDDYTIGDSEYTDGSSYYDDSEDESYERALSVFSRRGNNHYTAEKRRTPYNIRDNIQNGGDVLQNRNMDNQMNQMTPKVVYANRNPSKVSKTYEKEQTHQRSRSYIQNRPDYRTSIKKPEIHAQGEDQTTTSPFYVNNYLTGNNDENRYQTKPQERTLKPTNPYLTTRPIENPIIEKLVKFRDEIKNDLSKCKMNHTNIFSAVASCAYTNSSNAQYPECFTEYMRSARQEYTKGLRLNRQLKDNSVTKGAPEPFYMARRYSRSKTLLLDMDETLIHSEEYDNSKNQRGHPKRYDFVIEMNANNRSTKIGVYIRPYCLEFLRRMSQKYEVVIFTAARQDYADKILDQIDPSRTLFAGRMYRQHCTQVDGSYVKDFTVVKNRRKQDMMLVDNLIYSFAGDIDRGIHIRNFYDDKTDSELEHLADILENMKPFMDLSEFLERNFGFQRFYDYL